MNSTLLEDNDIKALDAILTQLKITVVSFCNNPSPFPLYLPPQCTLDELYSRSKLIEEQIEEVKKAWKDKSRDRVGVAVKYSSLVGQLRGYRDAMSIILQKPVYSGEAIETLEV